MIQTKQVKYKRKLRTYSTRFFFCSKIRKLKAILFTLVFKRQKYILNKLKESKIFFLTIRIESIFSKYQMIL